VTDKVVNFILHTERFDGQFFVQPATGVYVDHAATGANDGSSWDDAYTSLQDALDVASGSDEIYIAQGTYYPDEGLVASRRASFTITGDQDGLEIYGGFENGDAFADRSPADHPVILSGDIDQDNTSAQNSYHVVVMDGGNADEIGNDVDANITNATELNGVTITGGNANSDSEDANGGGLYCDGKGSGNACSPTLTHVVFDGNAADGRSGEGGAVYNNGSAGGSSRSVIKSSVFVGNTASLGGAIYDDADGNDSTCETEITNSIFRNNSTAAVVGDSDGNGTVNTKIINSTFQNNSVALYDSGFPANFTVENSVVSGNESGGLSQILAGNNNTNFDVSNTLVDGGCPSGPQYNCSSGVVTEAPRFVDPADADGADAIFATADDGLRLKPGSPALDVGNNNAISAPDDITGADRDQNGTVDLGAYEGATPAAVHVTGTDGTGNDAGWRMFSFPQDITRADIEDDFNYDFDAFTGHAAYVWNASAQQWDPLQNKSDPIAAGQGVAVYFFDDSDDPIESNDGPGVAAAVIDDPTQPVQKSIDQNGRFVLVGNPYTSAFDLSELDMTAANGFQQTVQIWDPDAGAFTTKDRSQGETVAAMQGFFVERTNPGSGPTSLTFSKSGVQNGPGSFIGTKSEAPALASANVELRLVVESEGDTLAQNRATVLFHEGAAPGWDAYDATQLAPPGNGAHATLTSPIERLGSLTRRRVAAEPFPEGTPAEVPLSVRSVGTEGSTDGSTDGSTEGGIAGTAHIELIGAPDASGPIELIDAETGATVDLRTEGYSFPLAAGDGSIESPSEARFTLRAGAGALPVELTRLTATADAGGVLLEWTTAAETQNAGFEIERRDRTGAWSRIGFQEGAGTTTEAQDYRFTDPDPPYAVDTLRYRLRQIDTDGTATLSDPATVVRDRPEGLQLLGSAPNPARQRATVRYGIPDALARRGDEGTLELYDVMGRRVQSVRVPGEAGRHARTLNVRGLSSGLYMLRLEVASTARTQKLTIVR
jgi:hypothetical protein